MNARAHFPQLPLGDGESSPPSQAQRPVAGGETWNPSPQYVRLFGNLTPEQVMTGAPQLTDSDPSGLAGHLLSPAIRDIAALRARHFAKGHTPETDAKRGPVWFWHGIHEFWWKASDACRDPDRRRKAKIAAAALIVASIDADDFLAQQEAAQ